MGVRIDEHGCLIVGNFAVPVAVVPAIEEFFRERFAQTTEPSTPDEREWEYGITWSPPVNGGEPASYDGCETLEGARAVGRQLAGPVQTATIWKRPMRPAVMAIPVGEWEMVPDAS